MSKTTVGAGAVIALASVLAIGAVAYDDGERTPEGHQASNGICWWVVSFEYPDGTTDYTKAFDYFGEYESVREVYGNGYRLTASQYPDPPDGYEWDHGPDYRYTEDTVVKAVPTA